MEEMTMAMRRRTMPLPLEERARRMVRRLYTERRIHGYDLAELVDQMARVEASRATDSRFMRDAVRATLVACGRRAVGLPEASTLPIPPASARA
jgi:hypothetical protein